MQSLLIELHFLPSLEYFCALQPFEKILLEKHENFVKQTYRNRCFLLTAQGEARLTIPLTARHIKVRITDVEIDYSVHWQNNFWRTLQSAYAKAPFYEHYSDDLKEEIFSGHKYLFDLNFSLLSMCLKWLKWGKTISESVTYEKEYPPEINDFRGLISAKKDFRQRGFYQPESYRQVFGNNFAPNLSLMDLVFCEGPNATAVIGASQQKKVNK